MQVAGVAAGADRAGDMGIRLACLSANYVAAIDDVYVDWIC